MNRLSLPSLLPVVVGAGGVWVSEARADCEVGERQKLVAAAPDREDRLGSSVALGGEWLLLGAPWAGDVGFRSGSVLVYRFDGTAWIEHQRIVAFDGAAEDRFGSAVAVAGDVAAMGSPGDDDGVASSGSVYLYRFDGASWQFEQKLGASDAGPSRLFGSALAIEGARLIVGSPGGAQAAAYVVEYDGAAWQERHQIQPSRVMWGFGSALALDGDAVAIGAPDDGAGGALVLRHDGVDWVEEAELVGSNSVIGDRFGFAMAMDGDRVVVGAPRSGPVASNSGSVYEFGFDGASWSERARFGEDEPHQNFGTSVVAEADVLLVGAPHEAAAGTPSVYTYRHTGGRWIQRQQLIGRDTQTSDQLGWGIALEGERALVTAPFADVAAERRAGAAYEFVVSELGLDATPDVVRAGDTVTLESCGGLPGNPMMLAIVQVNDVHLFRGLLVTTFDGDGRFSLSATVPPGLVGLDVHFQTLGVAASGKLGLSNREEVAFR